MAVMVPVCDPVSPSTFGQPDFPGHRRVLPSVVTESLWSYASTIAAVFPATSTSPPPSLHLHGSHLHQPLRYILWAHHPQVDLHVTSTNNDTIIMGYSHLDAPLASPRNPTVSWWVPKNIFLHNLASWWVPQRHTDVPDVPLHSRW